LILLMNEKKLKNLWIKYNIFTKENYLDNFKLKNYKIEEDNINNYNEIDKLIYKVPSDDELILDVLNQLNKIKNKIIVFIL